ncbi:MAG: hypothetical protein ACTSPY_10385, partial [Candidatus Helarchaeota archaeon]
TIIFNDSNNNWGTPDTVYITIINNPPRSTHPADITVLQYLTYSINWTLTDDFGPGSYCILVNGTNTGWHTWQNNTIIIITIDTSLSGIYNYTIIYNDTYGVKGIPDIVIVNIRPFRPATTSGIPGFTLIFIIIGIISLVSISRNMLKKKITN